MNNTILNEQSNEDILILDRHQPDHSIKRPSFPPRNYLVINPPRTTNYLRDRQDGESTRGPSPRTAPY